MSRLRKLLALSPVLASLGALRAELGVVHEAATVPPALLPRARARTRPRVAELIARRRPELWALLALAAALDLWALSRNGWANVYYTAAVRSMSSSWHNFLFASFDPNGVMTVDKPPLALWVQALSVRVFGYHPLSMLVPQALMGVAAVALCYDLVRRRFGRAGGFVAGLVLALTPITVAISRHNNPDALLVLCCVAAVWFAVRGLEDGRARWLALAGIAVGLGFETKMGVALMVVPAIAAAWLWIAPRGRLRALRQLLAGGAAMVVVGGAWPLLVALTPAADRPWISGTTDNSIWSLILNYNGVGRLDGQSGGPAGTGGGGPFGGSAGPLRLLDAALGGQDGWLLGFALVSLLALVVLTRLRRSDPRSGWLLAVGGSFVVIAIAFSEARGIFHPYYVSLLAPFLAALTGAGAALALRGGRVARVFAPLAVVAGVVSELVVLGDYPGELPWLVPLLVVAGILCAAALAAPLRRRTRVAAFAAVVGALLLGPAIWSIDTLGHATSGTFPAGGPAALADGAGGGPGGGPAGGPGGGGPAGHARGAFGAGGASGPGAVAPLFASPGGAGAAGAAPAPPAAPGPANGPAGNGPASNGPAGNAPALGGFAPGAGFGGGGGPFGGQSLTAVLGYVRAHGGGTVAVASQSQASSAVIAGADVAGIGGFSGRESSVSISWLAAEVASGHIRWVLTDGAGTGIAAGPGGGPAGGAGLAGDTRAGSRTALSAVTQACRSVSSSALSSSSGTLYDCGGRAAALAAKAT